MGIEDHWSDKKRDGDKLPGNTEEQTAAAPPSRVAAREETARRKREKRTTEEGEEDAIGRPDPPCSRREVGSFVTYSHVHSSIYRNPAWR